MYKSLNNAGINTENLLGYADDLCVLCTSPSELRRVIKLIKHWSRENNLALNAKKSGILEFTPRLGKQSNYLQINSEFEGIPIVTEYRYLGLIFNGKLTMKNQLEQIDKKTNFQVSKLWPILKVASLEERINLWTLLIRPLFEMLIFPYYAERSFTNIKSVEILIRKTFKKFCLFKKNVDNPTIDNLMEFDFAQRAGEVVEITVMKWEARKNNKELNIPKQQQPKYEKSYFPKELQELINLKTTLCPRCKTPCSSEHLLENHDILIPENEEFIKIMKTETIAKIKVGKKKLQVLGELGKMITPYILKIKGILTQNDKKQVTPTPSV